MTSFIHIGSRRVSSGDPVYVVAEISANHNGRFDDALALVRVAKECGADAVKVQTYTPDTMTLDLDAPVFQIGGGTLWDGRTLHDLYAQAFMPWEWQPKLKEEAASLGIELFSTAFDATAVDFLESIGVAAHKVASFEIVDIPLIRKMASTGKPMIISTGMSTREEVNEAVSAARTAGARDIVLLKCTSAYPAPPESMNLRTIADLSATFGVPAGLSDHTLGTTVPVAAVGCGACLVEKHITLTRSTPGPDSPFSLEPREFKAMVDAVRVAWTSLGQVHYGPGEDERKSLAFRRSLFAVARIAKGEKLTEANVRAIRPGMGLAPKHWDAVLQKSAARDIEAGTPLDWSMLT